MLLPLSLLFVGTVLTLNAIWMSGRIANLEIILINIVVAIITSGVALHAIAYATDTSDIKSAALTLLFTTTYLWMAYNRMTATDGRGLGWFSLIVAITVTPEAIITISAADSPLALWLGLNWAVWAVLWFMYFLLLTLAKPIQSVTAAATLFAGIFTAWLPAMGMLYGVLL